MARSEDIKLIMFPDNKVLAAIKKLEEVRIPIKDRIFILYISTPEDEQRFADLAGWGINDDL